MIVYDYPLSWYISKLKNREYFSLGRYGDAEWLAIFKRPIGRRSGNRTTYTRRLCNALRASLDYTGKNFYFSTAHIFIGMWKSRGFERRVDSTGRSEFVEVEVWDIQSRLGGCVDFIKQLQGMKTCIISNANLRRLNFLEYDEFIEISHPNCFPEVNSVIDRVSKVGNGYVYLISAGMPATLIAQAIHQSFSEVFALDLGSMWDAFVGIGAQRGWRRELYQDPGKYQDWKNLYKEVWDGKS